MNLKQYAVIVAGGSGKRMNCNISKQFIELDGVPILMRTINAFAAVQPQPLIIVVLPTSQICYWEQLCAKYEFSTKHYVIEGGNERFFSVRNGLSLVDDNHSLVAIHDGVRPLVSPNLIESAYRYAHLHGSAIPTVQPVDSIRIINDSASVSFPRNKVMLVQTPQTFSSEIIKEAYTQNFNPEFTDDASVVESIGNPIFTFEGERNNIKITTHDDLTLAHFLLQNRTLV